MATFELRPATPEDEPFLRELYDSTRREEVAAFGWDEPTQHAFLDQQYAWRRQGEAALGRQLERRIITVGGAPAGLIATVAHHRTTEVHDIALLPEHRGRGVGTAVLRAEIAAAAAQGRGLMLSVLSGGRAAGLYLRLGLRAVEDDGIYTTMTTWQGEGT